MGTNDATVCVVVDDPEVREALTRLLRSAGWRVETFVGAGDFLGASDRIEVGCVLLDVAMPDMPGPELHA
ncbi:MAG TPA: response regulator, partial [Arenimonas sp.]|nr:response regulator [Arenimonas sp.]